MIDAKNHYWIVSASDAKVYSSAANTFVAADDAAYVGWLAGGGMPSRIINEAELWDVLAQSAPDYLAPWLFDGATFVQPGAGTYSKVQLTAYAAARRYLVETDGVSFNGASIATDRQSQAMISGAFNLSQVNPAISIKFKTAGGFVTLNAAAISALAVFVAAHVQSCFSKEADIADLIAAGTMTQPREIDIAFTTL